jgi:hypothetical protein
MTVGCRHEDVPADPQQFLDMMPLGGPVSDVLDDGRADA